MKKGKKHIKLKFYYEKGIKKLKLEKDKLTWDNICDILMKAF